MASKNSTLSYDTLIVRPRVTEKSTVQGESNVYTFNVDQRANKTEVKRAIKALFKVSPIKVNIIAIPKKNVFIRGKKGVRGGGKKALVYLKKGDKIEFV